MCRMSIGQRPQEEAAEALRAREGDVGHQEQSAFESEAGSAQISSKVEDIMTVGEGHQDGLSPLEGAEESGVGVGGGERPGAGNDSAKTMDDMFAGLSFG
jgi:hypothetical protein